MKHAHAGKNHYVHLLVMTALSFVSMYVLMYAMVDRLANIYGNLNQFYMAGLMTAPMVLIEMGVMGAMYANKRLNLAIMIASVVVGVLFFVGIRQQTAIGDVQFLKSMIPHHASALLMCNEAPIADAEIQELCKTIVAGQQAEINQMKAMLARLEQR
jgi:uncharacterized protein (DUF305 family)